MNMECAKTSNKTSISNDDVIKWKHFPRYWPFLREFLATGEFPAQRPVTRSFDVSLICALNKRLGKQSWGWWFENPSYSLWRHRNDSGLCTAWNMICTKIYEDSYDNVAHGIAGKFQHWTISHNPDNIEVTSLIKTSKVHCKIMWCLSFFQSFIYVTYTFTSVLLMIYHERRLCHQVCTIWPLILTRIICMWIHTIIFTMRCN